MRCKNCGSENEENLYICPNCGAPLYDEDEPIDGQTAAEDPTQVVPSVNTQTNQQHQTSTAQQSGVYSDSTQNSQGPTPEDEKKKKQMIAIIVVLCIVLVVVIGVIIGVVIKSNSSKNQVTTTVTSTTTTEATTRQETTTQKPTTTTTTTTETTTEEVNYQVSVSCKTGGIVNGGGMFQKNETCTVTAQADPGYTFSGWYLNNSLVSSNPTYSFNVKQNTTLEARFTEESTQQ